MPKSTKLQILKDFKPKVIITNICLLCSSFYIINIFFTLFFNRFFGLHLHIGQIFSDKAIDYSTRYGYSFLFSSFFTNVFMIAAFVLFVDKAKNILDFVLTNFFIHLILCTLYDGFPSRFIWWFHHFIMITIVTLISEYIALRIEQQEIKLDFSVTKKQKNSDLIKYVNIDKEA